jgi:hypothetical protein
MSIIIPVAKTEIDTKFSSQRFGMLGLPGIGKSEFFAQDENALFINTEKGLNGVRVFQVEVRSWDELREAYGYISNCFKDNKFPTKDNKPYSIVIVDTVDRLVDLATEEVITRAKDFYKKVEINTISDIPQGGGWYRQKEMVMGFFNKLSLLPCAVAYIAHMDIKRIKDTTAEFDKATISIGGSLGDDLLAFTDHTMHIESHRIGDRIQRIVYTIPTQSREAKSRGGMIPNMMKWGDSTTDNYKAFRALFK